MQYSKNDLYILNECNVPITKQFIETLLKSYNIDHKIVNINNFHEAMTHMSYLIRDENFYKNSKTKLYHVQTHDIVKIDDPTKAIPLQKHSYERLEFLGDSIIHMILAEYLFKRYNECDEGFMTRLRTKIESGDTLTILSKSINLDKYIIISRYMEKNGARTSNVKVLEDAFESFIGALYLDCGFDITKQFLISLIEAKIDLSNMIYVETNHKEKLMQFCHTKKITEPTYELVDISGPENKKVFKTYAMCQTKIIGIGIGSSKKNSEQHAAQKALEHFKNTETNEYIIFH